MKLRSVRHCLFLLSIAVLSFGAFAQTAPPTAPPIPPDDDATFAYPAPPDRGAAALRETLRKLRTRSSIIMVTAHPDDEDGGMLAYESRSVGAVTSLLTLNRGEGGQNVMSSNYWDGLGLLRTEELLAADRYYGVHQYWTRAADFGFSKTLEEGIHAWGHDRVLYDVVRVIRMTRPLVITSVFTGNVSDGHGQHQVAGEMAQEAYKAAGDPNVFPDQIQAGLRPWTPLKVYARAPFARVTAQGVYDYATGHWAPARFRNYVDGSWIEGSPSATVSVPEGRYDPYPGLTYFQLGRLGLNEQKSQNAGIGLPAPEPQASSSYHLYASRLPHAATETDFFEGIDVSLQGIASYAPPRRQANWRARLGKLSAIADRATAQFSPDDPSSIAPLLAKGLKQTRQLIAEIAASSLPEDARYNMTQELDAKSRQFNRALRESLGLSLMAEVETSSPAPHRPWSDRSTFQIAVPGQQFTVDVDLANQGNEAITVKNLVLKASAVSSSRTASAWTIAPLSAPQHVLAGGEASMASFSVAVSKDAELTRPYFSRPSIEQPYYDIDDPRDLNLSASPYPLKAELTAVYRGVPFDLQRAVQTVHRETGRGPVLEPLIVGPAISLWLRSKAGIASISGEPLHLAVTVHSNVKGPAHGSVQFVLPAGWTASPVRADWATEKDGDERTASFLIRPKDVRPQTYTLQATAQYSGESFREGYRMTGYPGVRPYPYYRPAIYRATGAKIRIPHDLKVGYIMGTGDDVPRALEDLGIQPAMLSGDDLATGDLSVYNVIVAGIRAYAVRGDLRAFNWRLLDYVKQGGVLLVQYQTPDFDRGYSPYPLMLGGNPEKVIDERAAVTLIRLNDPLLAWPNRITAADFAGWVEERGHDFVSQWSPEYVATTEVSDPGQSPQRGGLLYARYGKGVYVYAAYAFYRQLPEGVPGAFRIFANLLSIGKNPAFASAK